ncbi:wax ester/triacylglycerol synthase family O-acyltransferase [Pseudomonas sp. N040]|uniref:wax ester/triacylglycerol synthase family O-acyltransferase n=1 Tax=Pseudomonas sp. N040 TaxID=2785325 RepID=UPI0018A2B562|nr:wax ester/triacylglycerol synthase family O-acyltransferase [Pseudomonas sp. N040]MBF7729925.1 wax ester/triacylglycerol synthase family O-acyltransferase [Pseudomonas sp. N040]MBW7013567.1 wax ester/triacylglycerol synthase family O-acyltransferase [Pseudomonas sp. N040]
MEQLSGLDNFMLYDEQGNVYNHVAALGIYDPSTAPNGKTRFKDILHHFKSRMGEFPIFRRKLVTVPYGLDRPYWADVGEIDVEFHIRHIALPHPGDWRQLMIQVARLHSRPLDRSRPLWEIYVIEGLDKIPGMHAGCFALFLKFHHSAVDGQHGTALLEAVHAITAEETHAAPRHYVLPESSTGPTALEMLGNVAKNAVARTVGLSSLYVSTASKVGALLWQRLPKPFLADDGMTRKLPISAAPLTRFNHPLSANRVVDAVQFPLSDIKLIRQGIPGCTINDVFLSVCGGALRRYLYAKGELPDESLRALMANSANEKLITKRKLRSNEIGGTPIALGTDIQDPVERLHAVRAETVNAKHTAEGLGLNLFQDLLDNLPEAAGRALMRHGLLPLLNVSASNVRGPEVPLYVAGARLLSFFPVSIATDFVGLNLTGFSYNGVLWISLVACRNMLPDPGFFTDCLRHSFNDLLEAAKSISAVRAAAASPASNVYAIGSAGKPKPLPAGKTAPAKARAASSKASGKAAASTTPHSKLAGKPASKPATTKAVTNAANKESVP